MQQSKVTEDGQEVFSTQKLSSSLPPTPPTTGAKPRPSVVEIEEEDDLDTKVPPDTRCKRNGCNVAFTSDEENRLGDGEGTVCTYHPKQV